MLPYQGIDVVYADVLAAGIVAIVVAVVYLVRQQRTRKDQIQSTLLHINCMAVFLLLQRQE